MRKFFYLLLVFSVMFIFMRSMTLYVKSEDTVSFLTPDSIIVDTTETEHTKTEYNQDVTESSVETEESLETTTATAETEPSSEPQSEEIVTTNTEPDSSWTYMGNFQLTAYCSCQTCCGEYALNRPVDENGIQIVYTASGARAEAGVTIAVDPRIIPYGTKVRINGHIYTAQDTGGGIKGNRIDVYFDDHQEALQFGLQSADVEILSQ